MNLTRYSILAATLLAGTAVQAAQVNVYSARQEALIKPMLDQFTKETGIKVNLITGNPDELVSRIQSEGRNSPADLLISTDVGRLYRAEQAGVLQAVDSKVLTDAIPKSLRDSENHWFGLTMRARPVMYVSGKVDAAELSSMEDLASPKWKGKICVRSSDNIYNQSLVASFIAHHGEEKAQAWATGFVKNFAQPPRGGDRDQIRAAVAGVCDLAISNTYYLGRMFDDDKTKDIAAKVSVFWPDQNSFGAHVNISGAGLAKHAPNKAAALQLLEFMVKPESQTWYAVVNHEYPVVPGVKWSERLQGFGEFKADQLQLEKLGELNAKAIEIMDKAGWK